MRAVTPAEVEAWTQLAAEHGLVNDDGQVALGRFVILDDDPGGITVGLVTPIVAGRYGEQLERKQPPIMFDRTEDGEIILPGRWWQHMFERLAEREPSDAARALARAKF